MPPCPRAPAPPPPPSGRVLGPANIYSVYNGKHLESDIAQRTIGVTPNGFQHILDNHTVLSVQIANLDTSAMAAAAARNTAEIEASAKVAHKKAKVISSAAELSVQAQPLLEAIQQLQQSVQAVDQRLNALQASQGQCKCTIM